MEIWLPWVMNFIVFPTNDIHKCKRTCARAVRRRTRKWHDQVCCERPSNEIRISLWLALKLAPFPVCLMNTVFTPTGTVWSLYSLPTGTVWKCVTHTLSHVHMQTFCQKPTRVDVTRIQATIYASGHHIDGAPAAHGKLCMTDQWRAGFKHVPDQSSSRDTIS